MTVHIRTWFQASNDLMSSTGLLESGIGNTESGIRNPESGIKKKIKNKTKIRRHENFNEG